MKKKKVLLMLFILLFGASVNSFAYNSLHYAGTASGTFWSMCIGIGGEVINAEMWVLRKVGLMK